jgi:hypothetical protein
MFIDVLALLRERAGKESQHRVAVEQEYHEEDGGECQAGVGRDDRAGPERAQ